METFALGLTKKAVEGTLFAVKRAIEEEAGLKVRVQNDLVFITGEFQMMRSFLNEANAERAQNEVARTWVRQLRDLAFDVEDCVELVINLNTTSTWISSAKRWVSSWPCIRKVRPVDVAAAEIQQLKARVMDVSQRNTRYNLLGNFGDVPGSKMAATTTYASASSSQFHILRGVWEAAGKLGDTGDLKSLITSEGGHLQVISVWGSSCNMEGAADHLGAMSIIREVYNDPEIHNRFSCRAWVKPTHPFNPDEFLSTVLTQFYTTSHQPNIGADYMKKMKAAVARENDELMNLVSEQRYLIVLEDVSTMVEWDTIRMYLPINNKGSRVVVSTQQLGIALMCTGDSYQVSQLTHFSDGQSICAFSKKGSVLSEFIWQIRRRGVISVLLNSDDNSAHIHQVYYGITHKRKQFDEVIFEKHSWVDVPSPFNINDFAARLLLNFQSGDFKPTEIAAPGVQEIIEQCCMYLHGYDCLLVINGLESTGDWELIKNIFLSKPTKGSIIAIAKEASVAAQCAEQQNRVFNTADVQADKVLVRLLNDSRNGSMMNSRNVHLFYNLMDEANEWYTKFQLVDRENEVSALVQQIRNPGVISVWGRSGLGKSALVRSIYYKEILMSSAQHSPENKLPSPQAFSLVDVPHPFNLRDFSWHLLLDFYSHDHNAKEKVAVHLMDGQDPIKACHVMLHTRKCLVVLDGLRTTHDWDIIRYTFLSEHTESCIIVITNVESVAIYCAQDPGRVVSIKNQQTGDPITPLSEDPRRGSFSSSYLVACGKESTCHNQELFGRRDELTHLNKFLGSPGVICLWGVAGVGKSALVKSLYHDQICTSGRHTQSTTSWVDVPHPFNLMEFSRRLLLGFHSKDLQSMEIAAVGIMEGLDAIQACGQFLRQRDCMIVIDGLRSTHDWDLIKDAFSFEPTRSQCIIVITTEVVVATHCISDKSRVHNVKGLNTEDALGLFEKVAWGGKKLSAEEIKFSKLTVGKCGGLPKVIEAIGEYAAEETRKTSQHWREMTLTTISKDIHDDFMCKLETDSRFHGLRGLFSWMRSYFNACSDSLKPCIFYLSVFPTENKSIRGKRLLRRWIAEGYSRDTPGGGTAEEMGEKLFKELIELSIIQQRKTPSRNSSSIMQVNGFFHEYIISRQMEDNLVYALEGHCSVNSQRSGQHLAIRSSWDRDEVVFKSMDLSRTRSLTVFGEWKSFFISSDVNMRLLRVLDLEDTSDLIDENLEQIGKLLPHLKFLSVRGCVAITSLPSSLGGLRQLQTLDVRGTKITTLPPAIIMLLKLQYIRAGITNEPSDGLGISQPEAGNDGVATSLSATYGDVASTIQPTAAESDGTSTSQPKPDDPGASTSHPVIDKDWISTPMREGEDMVPTRAILTQEGGDLSINQLEKEATESDRISVSQPAIDGECTDTCQPAADSDGARTSQRSPDKVQISTLFEHRNGIIPSVATLMKNGDGTSTCRPPAVGGDGTPSSQQEADQDQTLTLVADDIGMVPSVATLGKEGDDTNTNQPSVEAAKGGGTRASQRKVYGNGARKGHLVADSDGGSTMQPTLDTVRTSTSAEDSNGIGPSVAIVMKEGDGGRTSLPVVVVESDGTATSQPTVDEDMTSASTSDGPGLGMAPSAAAEAKDDDGMSTNQAAKEDSDYTKTSQLEAEDHSSSTSKPVADKHQTSASMGNGKGIVPSATTLAKQGECTSTSQPTSLDGNDIIMTGASTSQPAVDEDQISSSTSDDDCIISQPAINEDRTSTTPAPCSNMARDFLSNSWLSRHLRGRQSINSIWNGVKVHAAGISNLTILHTLGVVNVSASGGKAILTELKKLTQLRKLGVSGVNKENWEGLCAVISGHAHLESLSVRLDSGFAPSFDDISEPPKTLQSLKLYGNVHVSPVWIKKLGNLIKADLELTISTQKDINSLIKLPCQDMFRLCVNASKEFESPLNYGWSLDHWYGEGFKTPVLKIDCGGNKLEIAFGDWIPSYVEILEVHCSSTAACLKVSRLGKLTRLKKISLKGSYSEAVKQHLQRKVNKHKKKPVLQLEDQPAGSS